MTDHSTWYSVQRSKRVLHQLCDNEKDGLHPIAVLTAKETAAPLDLKIKTHKLAK